MNTYRERLSFHVDIGRHLSSQYMREKLAHQWETGSSSAAILHACMRSKTFFLCFLFHLKDWVAPVKPEVVISAVQKNSAFFHTRAC